MSSSSRREKHIPLSKSKKPCNVITIVATFVVVTIAVVSCIYIFEGVNSEATVVIDSGTVSGTELTWTLYNDGVLKITGTGNVHGHIDSNVARTSTRHLILEEGVTGLDGWSFQQFTIERLTLPSTLTTLNSLDYFDHLEEITVNDLNPNYSSVDGVLYNNDGSELLKYPSYKEITAFNIQNGVTTVGYYAFDNCEYLREITIPASVTTINYAAIVDCASLLSIQVNGENGSYASVNGVLFNKGMTNLIKYPASKDANSYSVPGGITTIGYGAFSHCRSVQSIQLPDSVSEIGESAFEECISLTTVNIPSSVTMIKNNTFSGCVSLESITIPNGVTTIGNRAFESCQSLETIILPNSVTSVTYYAFSYCTSLRNLTLSSGLTAIDTGIFRDCRSLTSVVIPEGVESIRSQAFLSCTKLSSISFPSTLRVIDGSFSSCDSLQSVTFNEGLLELRNHAFSSCSNLRTVSVPSTVTIIDEDIFSSCYNLESITVDSNNDNYSSENGILFNAGKTRLILYPAGKSSTEYTVPASVTGLASYCFSNCTLETIHLNDNITSVGSRAFYNCWGLKNIELPNGLSSIPSGLFYQCQSLKTVTIPSGVTSIGDEAFYNCTSLKSITIPEGVVSIGNSSFSNCGSLVSIRIPSGVQSVSPNSFYACASLKEFVVDQGNNYYKSVDGVLYDRDVTTLIACPKMITNGILRIPSTLNTITIQNLVDCELFEVIVDSNNVSFSSDSGILFDKNKTQLIYCPKNLKMKTYTLPETVATVENRAFYGNNNIESITLNEGLLSIGVEAFSNCSHLKTITIPANVSNISYSFYGSNALESINVDNGNSRYSSVDGVLFDKQKTTLISYPAGKQNSSYSIPESVDTVHYNAFQGQTHLEELFIGSNVGGDALYLSNAWKLKSITVDSNNPYYSSVDGILYNKLKTEILCCPVMWAGELTISESINSELSTMFISNKGITAFNVASNNQMYTSVDGVLYSKDMKRLIAYPAGKNSEEFMVPASVECLSLPSSQSIINYAIVSNNIKKITVEDGNTSFSSVNGILFDKTGRILIACPGACKSLVIPNNTCIMTYPGILTVGIEEITFKEGSDILFIYSSAIVGDSLKRITIEDGVTLTYCSTVLGFTDGEKHTIEIYAPEGFIFKPSCIYGDADLVYKYKGDSASFSSETIAEIVDRANIDSELSIGFGLSDMVIRFDNKALKALAIEATSLEMKTIPEGDVDPEIKKLIGDSTVLQITFGNNRQFGDGKLSLEIKYAISEGKDVSKYKIYYIDGGEIVEKLDCRYNDGILMFDTNHLSTYAIVYEGETSTPSNNNAVLFAIGGAVVALAIIGGAAVFFLRRR